jgi:segregation and condensation protein A
MSHTVTIEKFEGPLALLLDLVERRQLEVTDISIAAITADYLGYINQLDHVEAEGLSEFLGLGARLVYIKSLALLPRESASEQADELRQLNLELAEYRRYQQAARELSRLARGATWPRPVVSRLDASRRSLPDLGVEQLAAAFTAALRQAEPIRPQGVLQQPISQAAITQRLQRQLAQGPLELQPLLDHARDRLEIVVTFLAVLELMKQGAMRVVQDGQFAPVIMEAIHV